VRVYNKLIDEYVHNCVHHLTFATAFRAVVRRPERRGNREAPRQVASKQRTEYKRDVASTAWNQICPRSTRPPREAAEDDGRRIAKWNLARRRPFFASGRRGDSVHPALWIYCTWGRSGRISEDRAVGTSAWRERPSVKKELIERMTPQDKRRSRSSSPNRGRKWRSWYGRPDRRHVARRGAAAGDRRSGEFKRVESVFRDRITADGSSGYKAEAGRYHLYIAWNCPWRTAC